MVKLSLMRKRGKKKGDSTQNSIRLNSIDSVWGDTFFQNFMVHGGDFMQMHSKF